MKIAIQTGLEELAEELKAKGYEVVPFRSSGQNVRISILNDIDAEYEEIDPVTFMGEPDEEMVLLDASKLSKNEILVFVDKYMKN